MKANILKDLGDSLAALSTILAISVCVSYCANFFWLADIFSHFLLQYIIGSVVLGGLGLALKNYRYVVLNIAILCLCLGEMSFTIDRKVEQNTALNPEISIVQFNKLVSNTNYLEIKTWIMKQDQPFDFIVFQEADNGLLELSNDLKNIYPYQIREPRNHAFGTIILSRYDFLDTEKIDIQGQEFKNFATKVIIHPLNFKNTLSIFSLHAVPPTSHEFWTQRNYELKTVTENIGDTEKKNTIFIGDWNITPYSPFFKKVLYGTNLNMAKRSYVYEPTWPSTFKTPLFPIFQIPIDHILFSDTLIPLYKEIGESFGSDHHPVIMKFIEKKN